MATSLVACASCPPPYGVEPPPSTVLSRGGRGGGSSPRGCQDDPGARGHDEVQERDRRVRVRVEVDAGSVWAQSALDGKRCLTPLSREGMPGKVSIDRAEFEKL